MTALAARVQFTNAALAAVVDRLAEAGLVERRPDPTDRRRQLVDLTAEARQVSSSMSAGLYRRVDQALARYSDAELAIIVDFLAHARQALLGHAADLLADES